MSVNAWPNSGGTFVHLFFACLAFLSTVALRAEVHLPDICGELLRQAPLSPSHFVERRNTLRQIVWAAGVSICVQAPPAALSSSLFRGVIRLP
jgi:hypothetical protein